MSIDLQKTIFLAEQAEKVALEAMRNVLNNVLASIEEAKVPDGYREISDNPRCFTMSLSGICKGTNLSFDPRIHDIGYQIAKLRKKFEQCQTLDGMKHVLFRAVEEKVVIVDNEKVPLHSNVTQKIAEILANIEWEAD